MTSAALVHDHRCQQGHSTRLAWDAVQLLSLLDEGPLALYCAQCKTARSATEDERVSLRRLAAIAAGRPVPNAPRTTREEMKSLSRSQPVERADIELSSSMTVAQHLALVGRNLPPAAGILPTVMAALK